MPNIPAVIDICKAAESFYGRFFDYRGFGYYTPVMNNCEVQEVHGEAAQVVDNFIRAPTDLRVSCQTDTYLPAGLGGLAPIRLLKLEPLGGLLEIDDCNWRCADQIMATATTTHHVKKLFDQMMLTKFRIDIGAFIDTSIRELMTSSIPTTRGTAISAADDGIATVTIDDILTFETVLRNAIAEHIIDQSFESIGDVIIYGDKDLQKVINNASVMGRNVFGGCCGSEFAANITRCTGETSLNTLSYTVPLTKMPNGDKFFKEEGGYRYYFVIASRRVVFGYNPSFVEMKLEDCCGVPVPYTSPYMEKIIGCDFIKSYHEVLERVAGRSWFFMKRNRNPIHKKNIYEEIEMGAMAAFTRRPNLGFILKIKTDMFTKYITNSQLTAGDLPTATTTAAEVRPIAAEYINDKDKNNANVKPVNKK